MIFSVLGASDFANGSVSYPYMLFTLGGAILSYSLMLLIGLYVTNRVAGPLYRLREHMEAFNRGEKIGPLETRSDDYVSKDLIEQYNLMMEKLKQ